MWYISNLSQYIFINKYFILLEMQTGLDAKGEPMAPGQ